MSNEPCMLDLARDLAEIASETRDPDTAIRLIALANEVLAAAGHLPTAGDVDPIDASDETQ
jgi:hypothetical protein